MALWRLFGQTSARNTAERPATSRLTTFVASLPFIYLNSQPVRFGHTPIPYAPCVAIGNNHLAGVRRRANAPTGRRGVRWFWYGSESAAKHSRISAPRAGVDFRSARTPLLIGIMFATSRRLRMACCSRSGLMALIRDLSSSVLDATGVLYTDIQQIRRSA